MSRGQSNFGYGSLSQTESGDLHDVQRPGNFRSTTPIDASYKDLCDKISGNLFTIGVNVTSMEQAHKQLGMAKDSVQLRQKLHNIEKSTNSLVSETSTALRQLRSLFSRPSEGARVYRLQFQRLMAEFKEVTQRYNVMQKKVAEKVRLTNPPPAPLQPRVPTGDLVSWGEANDDDVQQQQQRQQRQQQLLLEDEAIDVEVAILQERENNIRQLEADVLDINAIFRELGLLVHEQGEVIDTIEANVTVASENVEQGREQLQKAAHYQASSRKKMCCLLVFLLIVVAVIVIVVVIAVKVH